MRHGLLFLALAVAVPGCETLEDEPWVLQPEEVTESSPCHWNVCLLPTDDFLAASRGTEPILLHPLTFDGFADLQVAKNHLILELRPEGSETGGLWLLNLTTGRYASFDLLDLEKPVDWVASGQRVLIAANTLGDDRPSLRVLDLESLRVNTVPSMPACRLDVGTFSGKWALLFRTGCDASATRETLLINVGTGEVLEAKRLLEPWRQGSLASPLSVVGDSLYFMQRANAHYRTPSDLYRINLDSKETTAVIQGLDWVPSEVLPMGERVIVKGHFQGEERATCLHENGSTAPVAGAGLRPAQGGLLVTFSYEYPQQLYWQDQASVCLPEYDYLRPVPSAEWETGISFAGAGEWMAFELSKPRPGGNPWDRVDQGIYVWRFTE